jgi:hypothetical protein
MTEAYWHIWGEKKCIQNCGGETLKDRLEHRGTNGRVISKHVLKKEDEGMD